MNKEILKGHWHEAKGKIKEQWGNLTDDEIAQIDGSYEQLQGTLQKKYGFDKDKAEKEIDQFLQKQNWQ